MVSIIAVFFQYWMSSTLRSPRPDNARISASGLRFFSRTASKLKSFSSPSRLFSFVPPRSPRRLRQPADEARISKISSPTGTFRRFSSSRGEARTCLRFIKSLATGRPWKIETRNNLAAQLCQSNEKIRASILPKAPEAPSRISSKDLLLPGNLCHEQRMQSVGEIGSLCAVIFPRGIWPGNEFPICPGTALATFSINCDHLLPM